MAGLRICSGSSAIPCWLLCPVRIYWGFNVGEDGMGGREGNSEVFYKFWLLQKKMVNLVHEMYSFLPALEILSLAMGLHGPRSPLTLLGFLILCVCSILRAEYF